MQSAQIRVRILPVTGLTGGRCGSSPEAFEFIKRAVLIKSKSYEKNCVSFRLPSQHVTSFYCNCNKGEQCWPRIV